MPRIFSSDFKQIRTSPHYRFGEYTVHYGTEELFPVGDEEPVVEFMRRTVPDFEKYDLDNWGYHALLYETWFHENNRDIHLLSTKEAPYRIFWVAPD